MGPFGTNSVLSRAGRVIGVEDCSGTSGARGETMDMSSSDIQLPSADTFMVLR